VERAPQPCRLVVAPPSGPSDTSRSAWKGTRSARFPSRVTPFRPAHVNAAGLSEIEVPSIEQDQHGPLFRAVRVELCSRWPAGHSPHVFTVVREHRLDLCSLAVRVRLRGRVRLYDFCR